ncbi:hypothetical protein [Parapedobacter sp. DT-150]|uniref:hypothetical protein n=1 Tax=Parapedobacter sp. DT-150 TaxID=3396162 RepID=UPI003F1ACD8F
MTVRPGFNSSHAPQSHHDTYQPNHKLLLVDYTNPAIPLSLHNACGVNVAAVKGGNPVTENMNGYRLERRPLPPIILALFRQTIQ